MHLFLMYKIYGVKYSAKPGTVRTKSCYNCTISSECCAFKEVNQAMRNVSLFIRLERKLYNLQKVIIFLTPYHFEPQKRHEVTAAKEKYRYHTIIRAAFVCLCVRNQSPPRSFDGSSPNLVGVCRLTSHLPLRGSFSKRSTASRLNGSHSLSTILYRDQPHTTQLQKAPFALVPQLQSLIRCLLLLYINGICSWTWQLLSRGSFSKRSTGRWVNGLMGQRVDGSMGRRVNGSNRSTGQRVTFTFTILYMIST